MRTRRSIVRAVLLIAVSVFLGHPSRASAHHEALFGPQSSSVLSPDGFVTFQIFSRELGPSDDRTRESTAVVGAGIRVSRRHPITFSAVVPYSWISEAGASRNGAEDALFSVRYRHDLKGLQERWSREGNFVMGMGAVELNGW